MKTPEVFHNLPTLNIRYSKLNSKPQTPTELEWNWSLVRPFLAALEHGSLLGAARVLGSTQPTVGRQIAELERQWGVVLFERHGRGLTPTAMALQLANTAHSLRAQADQLARLTTGAAHQGLRGTVRLSASQPVACYVLPPLLAQMRQSLPDIQVELVVSNAISNLLRREADIALRMVRPEGASLITKRVAQVTLGAWARRDYLRRRGTPKTPDELLAHELVGTDRDTTLLRGFAAMGVSVTAEHFAFRTDDLIAYWEAVRAGLGIGFLANYLARRDAELQSILPMLKIPPLPVWLTVHREIRSNPRIRAVYDYLSATLPNAFEA